LKTKLTFFAASAFSVPGVFNTAKRYRRGYGQVIAEQTEFGELAVRPELGLIGMEGSTGSGVV